MTRVYLWQRGLASGRPLPGIQNRLYFATDTGNWFIDNGVSWDPANLTPRGAYSAGTAYYKHDLVTSAGSTWRALQAVTGVTPVEGANWTIFAAKGDAGGVSSFNTRTGAVVPASGDYNAGQIANTAAGQITSTNVQSAINELDGLLRLSRTVVSITGATTLTSTAFGKMHVCSGTSADYTVGLPAVSGNAGKVIGFRMASSMTKLVTLDANSSELINSTLTLVMGAGQAVLLECNGSGWAKLAAAPPDQRMDVVATKGAATSQSITALTFTKVTFDVEGKDATGEWELANSRLVATRAMTALMNFGVLFPNSVADGTRVLLAIYKNGAEAYRLFDWITGAAGTPAPSNAALMDVAAGDVFEFYIYTGVATTIQGGGCQVKIREIP